MSKTSLYLRLILSHVESLGVKMDLLNRKVDDVMATVNELTAELNAVKDQVVKIGTETRTLLTKIDDLTAIITSGNVPVPPDVQAALDDLKAQAKVVDDLVVDAPTA